MWRTAQRLAPLVFLLSLAWIAGVTPVVAQCAMCGTAAQQAGDPETVNRVFGAAVLIMLIPVLLVLGGIAVLVWKARNWDGAWQPGVEPPLPPPGDSAAWGAQRR